MASSHIRYIISGSPQPAKLPPAPHSTEFTDTIKLTTIKKFMEKIYWEFIVSNLASNKKTMSKKT